MSKLSEPNIDILSKIVKDENFIEQLADDLFE